MSTHAYHFCVCNTPAGRGQIVTADIVYDLFEKTLLLTGEVVLFDTAIRKIKERQVFKGICISSEIY